MTRQSEMSNRLLEAHGEVPIKFSPAKKGGAVGNGAFATLGWVELAFPFWSLDLWSVRAH